MFQSIYDRYNEREISAYREGAEEALRFKANHGDLRQDLFRAETDDYKIYVGYDDVEFGTFVEVTFKGRYDRRYPDCLLKVMVCCGTGKKAMARAMRFIAAHPISEPYCSVDY